jgi:hypothetical protein
MKSAKQKMIGFGTYDVIKECHRFGLQFIDFCDVEIGTQFFMIPNTDTRSYTKHSKVMCNDGVDRFRVSPYTIVYIRK